MKWLDRILSKEEIPATIAFDEFDTWLEQVSDSLFRGLSANAVRLYTEMGEIIETLKHDIATLQTAESTEEVPDRIVKIGVLSRDKMVKHLFAVTEKIEIPAKTDYQTVSSFYKDTTAALEFPFGKSQTNIYCVRSLFPTEIKTTIADLKRLRASLDQLIAPLKGKERQIRQLERVPELVQAINDVRTGIKEKKTHLNEQEAACAALERNIETESSRLERIECSEEWKKFKALEGELSSVKEELNTLEANVLRLFAPLTKPLKLLKKQDETGRHTLTLDERTAIGSILSSPVRALNADVAKSLRAIQKVIEGDPAVLKDRKRETALNWIEQLLQADLASIKGKRERLQAQITETTSKLSDSTILQEKEELEHSIESAQGQRTQLREEIARAKKHIVSLDEELREKKQRLIKALEELAGNEIDVTFTF
ncbi:MAG: hypothetical protein JW878_05095 [Methanomicrobia archaeon]|nr:hypothetical protein [Methanomicrobia archaeon]